jgi:hypothetical protein
MPSSIKSAAVLTATPDSCRGEATNLAIVGFAGDVIHDQGLSRVGGGPCSWGEEVDDEPSEGAKCEWTGKIDELINVGQT